MDLPKFYTTFGDLFAWYDPRRRMATYNGINKALRSCIVASQMYVWGVCTGGKGI